jgi:hypothetical protein
VKLPKLRRGAPAAGQPRRRRPVRPDGPKTIVALDDDAAAAAAAPQPSTPLARDLDAARERLRRAIPPVSDDLE